MENLTSSEIAGFGVGALLLCATIAAPKVDAFISASQRSSLGMCKRCGDLKMIACSQCKGVGSVRKGGPFSFSMLEEIFESPGDGSTPKELIPCMKCCSKGRFPCSNCINLPPSLILFACFIGVALHSGYGGNITKLRSRLICSCKVEGNKSG